MVHYKMNLMKKEVIASMIDHTLLSPVAGVREIVRLCQEAKKFGFGAVCVNPSYVAVCKKELEYSNVKICTITEKKVLRGIDLELDDGDFVTVIGGNGAGKSMLLNIIAGVHYPDTGFVSLNDKDMTIVPEHIRAKYLGRVFQDPMMGTAANMSIEENLAMAMRRGKKRGLCWHIKDNEREFYKESSQTRRIVYL